LFPRAPRHPILVNFWFGDYVPIAVDENIFHISKLEEVFIHFFPFDDLQYVRSIESFIIQDLINRGVHLLNNHHNN
jgi:hypothetical protein